MEKSIQLQTRFYRIFAATHADVTEDFSLEHILSQCNFVRFVNAVLHFGGVFF